MLGLRQNSCANDKPLNQRLEMINKHYLFWKKMNTFGNTYNPINKVLVLNKVVGANDEPFFKKSIMSNKHLLLCKSDLTCLKGNMG
jgi:hypothetical protein